MTIAAFNAAYAEDAAPAPEKKPNVGYKGGAFIQSDDGAYKLKINGRLQPQYYFEKQRGREAVSTFKIRRANVGFNMTIAEKGHMGFTLQHSTQSTDFQTVNILGAIASYDLLPEMNVAVGMVGLPLSLSSDTSSKGFLMIEAPLAVTQVDGDDLTPMRNSFGTPDGLGIQLSGDIGKFYYAANLINGAATASPAESVNGVQVKAATGGEESNYDLNPNKHVSAGARVAYNIFGSWNGIEMDLPYSENPNWVVSMGGMYQGWRQDPNIQPVMTTIKRIMTGSVGTSFKWRGFAINAEMFGRRTYLDSPGSATWFEMKMDDFAYYVTTGYFVIPNTFEIAGAGSQIFREGPHNNSYQFGGCLNYYISHSNNLKLQLGYTLTGRYNYIANDQQNRISRVALMMTAAF
jgi:hypothetical protein